MKKVLVTAAALLIAVPAMAVATDYEPELDEAPPPNAMPLSEGLRLLEARPGFRSIVEMEYVDGLYLIEYLDVAGEEREATVDPIAGAVR